MPALRVLIKGLAIFPGIVGYIVQGYLINAFTRDALLRRTRMIENSSRYARFALAVMNVKVKVAGAKPELEVKGRLWVSNHLSWLDLLLMSSVSPIVFITSVDMSEVPLLGWMTKAGASIFVERRNRDHIANDIQQISDRLKEGFNVVLFAEGTSTDGSGVLPFRRSLMTAVLSAHTQMQPLTVQYKEINGEKFSLANRDFVCWYAKMSFAPHLLGLLSRRSVSAEVYVHPSMQYVATLDKEEMASRVRAVVASHYGHPLGPPTLKI